MMQDRIFARAVELAGNPDRVKQDQLRGLCDACSASLEARLREGMTGEDIPEPFVTAVSLYALAALLGLEGDAEEIRAGDLTVKQGGAAQRQKELRWQAEQLMGPYLRDNFLFAGV